jgi:putative peptidoglycan lipid II flippase
VKQAFTLGGFGIANMASALLFQWMFLTMLGPGIETDALFAGMTVPQLFATIISASMTQVLVPVFAGETPDEQRRDAWTLVIFYGGFFVVAAIALAASASIWAPLTVYGFSEDAKTMTTGFAMISVMGMVFTGINAVQTALAFAQNRYIWADSATILANLIALALLYYLLPLYGAIAVAWIAVARLAIQTIFLFRSMGRPAAIRLSAPVISLAWQRLKPLIFGAAYYKMDPLVDRFLLSSMVPGTLSLFYLAQQLFSAASQVVVKALATPAVTKLSIAAKEFKSVVFSSTLKRTAVQITAIGIASILALAFVGQPILSFLLEHRQFETQDTHMLWLIMLLSCGQFIWGALGSLLTGAFYSKGDTKTPTLLGCITFTIGIFIKVVMFKIWGIYGLAAAITLFFSLSIASQAAMLRFKYF